MQISDLDDNPLLLLLDSSFPPGRHMVQWHGHPRIGASTVYKCRFDVWSLDRTILVHQDTLYACCYDTDADGESGFLGFTDGDGVVSTNAKSRFPNTYEYPPLLVTDEQGLELGTFLFSDTLIIVAVNASASSQRVYKRVLEDRENFLELTWE
jgi:hypothetical protein